MYLNFYKFNFGANNVIKGKKMSLFWFLGKFHLYMNSFMRIILGLYHFRKPMSDGRFSNGSFKKMQSEWMCKEI